MVLRWAVAGAVPWIVGALIKVVVGKTEVRLLAGSNLMYALPYLLIAPNTEARYLGWSILATCIALLLQGWSWCSRPD